MAKSYDEDMPLPDHLSRKFQRLADGLGPLSHEELLRCLFKLIPIDSDGRVIQDHPDTKFIFEYLRSLQAARVRL